MLLTAFATSTIFLTSCEPTVMQETDCKAFAACAGCPLFVANELYDYVIETYTSNVSDGNDEELGDLVFEEGDDMWNLEILTDRVKKGSKNTVTSQNLIDLLISNITPTKANFPNIDEPLNYQEVEDSYLDHKAEKIVFVWGTKYRYNKDYAFKTAFDVCDGNFEPFKEKISQQVEVYDYRKDEKSSSKKTTVYDVVYLVNSNHYVRCSVVDLEGGHFEINYVSDSEMYSDLGY